MKKILSILSVLIIILMLFTSCNSVSEPTEKPSETSSPSETVDRKPTERPTKKPTEKPTEEPIVIPPREVTWDTTKYSIYEVSHMYDLLLPELLKEYYSAFGEQEGESAIPFIKNSIFIPEDTTAPQTMTVNFLGEEYVGTLNLLTTGPIYKYSTGYIDKVKHIFFIRDGQLIYFGITNLFSSEKPIISIEECEEKAKEYFSIQFPEIDITQYQITSYITENTSKDIAYEKRHVEFIKYFRDDFAQEIISFTFNANGELTKFSHNTYNRPSDNVDLSKIDMEEVYETFQKGVEYAFHIEKHLYPECVIRIPEELNRSVSKDGSVTFDGEVRIGYESGGDINIKHIYIKILP